MRAFRCGSQGPYSVSDCSGRQAAGAAPVPERQLRKWCYMQTRRWIMPDDVFEFAPKVIRFKGYICVSTSDAGNSHVGDATNVATVALVKTGRSPLEMFALSGGVLIVAITPSGTERSKRSAETRWRWEVLIAKRSASFDLSKIEAGYEIALKELVYAEVNHLLIPKDEAQRAPFGIVVSLMDALRKSSDNP